MKTTRKTKHNLCLCYILSIDMLDVVMINHDCYVYDFRMYDCHMMVSPQNALVSFCFLLNTWHFNVVEQSSRSSTGQGNTWVPRTRSTSIRPHYKHHQPQFGVNDIYQYMYICVYYIYMYVYTHVHICIWGNSNDIYIYILQLI